MEAKATKKTRKKCAPLSPGRSRIPGLLSDSQGVSIQGQSGGSSDRVRPRESFADEEKLSSRSLTPSRLPVFSRIPWAGVFKSGRGGVWVALRRFQSAKNGILKKEVLTGQELEFDSHEAGKMKSLGA